MRAAMLKRDQRDLGQRHRCDPCDRSYYDLGRLPARCPRCDAPATGPALDASRAESPAHAGISSTQASDGTIKG